MAKSAATFTPGPWTAARTVAGRHLIKSGRDDTIAETWLDPLVSTEAQKANARLIAAAPDLYEALAAFNLTKKEKILSGDADSLTLRVPLEILRKAATALAKACGERP